MPISPESLSQLMVAHAATLELYARQLCDAPEDAVQEAFVKLAVQRTLPQRVLPWLFEVTRNRSLSLRRSAARRRRHEERAARWDWFEPNPAAPVDAATATQALEQLPCEEREVLVAHVWGGLTFDEIGKLTATSSSTAHRRYCDGLVQVPGSLADVTIVPVPDDRYTEAPFVYSSAGDRAVLELRLHAYDSRQLDWEIELHPTGK